MFIRRIAASACALSLIIPAAAVAVPIHDPVAPEQQPAAVAYGDTKYDLQNQQDLSAPIGDTKSDLKPATNVDPSRPAVQLPTPGPRAGSRSPRTTTSNGWQIAAWAEAAVLAALAVGSAVLISGRTRSRRLSS